MAFLEPRPAGTRNNELREASQQASQQKLGGCHYREPPGAWIAGLEEQCVCVCELALRRNVCVCVCVCELALRRNVCVCVCVRARMHAR